MRAFRPFRGTTGALVALLLAAAAACSSSSAGRGATTSSTYPRGPASSTYWIAGWVPKPARVDNVARAGGRVEYAGPHAETGIAGRPEEPLFQVQARTVDAHTSVRTDCGSPGNSHLGRIRGHVSCEGPDSDEGHLFGWGVTWHERATLELKVLVGSPEEIGKARAMARRIAASVEPVSAQTWAVIVEKSQALGPLPASDTQREVVERGRVRDVPWTLTALVPRGYPLGPDDLRPACAEIAYNGEIARTCANDAGRGSRWARLANQVFAFGLVPAYARTLELQNFDIRGRPQEVVARNVSTVIVAAVDQRFYAVPMGAQDCFVAVYDVTDGHRRTVGDVNEIGYGPPCTPVFGGPATTAPTH